MSRGRRVKLGHPLTVAVVVATIGLIGTVAAAIITTQHGTEHPRPVTKASLVPPLRADCAHRRERRFRGLAAQP